MYKIYTKQFLYFIILFAFLITSIFAQETEKDKLKSKVKNKINSVLAPSGGTVDIKGSSNNVLATFTEEEDNSGGKFGSLIFTQASDAPSGSMKHKLWIDDSGQLFWWDDEVGTGWIRNSSNVIQLSNVNERVSIGAGSSNTSDKLTVNGKTITNAFKMADGSEGNGKVLTSDANGDATWQTPSGGSSGSIDGLSDGKSTPTSNSVYLGEGAGANDDSKIGTQTLASQNTAVGVNALNKNGLVSSDFGIKNTAIGFEALKNNDNNNANANTSVGYQSHFHNVSGYNNTAVGNQALYGYSGGFENIAIGYQALKGGNTSANGQQNIAIGVNALNDNVSGDNNIAIGYNAGFGHTGDDQLFIQNRTVSTYKPLIWGRFAPSSIRVQINGENESTTNMFYVNGSAGGTSSWSSSSDRRLKKNISTIHDALKKVKMLRGVNFEWKKPENHREGLQMGFIAQESIESIPEVVDDKSEFMSMEYAPITALLVEAVKEQNKEFKLRNKELKERIKKLEDENMNLKTVVSENKILNNRVNMIETALNKLILQKTELKVSKN